MDSRDADHASFHGTRITRIFARDSGHAEKELYHRDTAFVSSAALPPRDS